MTEMPKQFVRGVLQSGDSVPVSGVWRLDHDACRDKLELCLRKHELFPLCPSCGVSGCFRLLEEVQHISEDPDFQ